MQDVTDLPFWTLIAQYGGADLYVTEYFRVHAVSRLDRHILTSITRNPTARPVLAQMIGNDIPALVRTARELQRHPVAGVDVNLGCPAPVVYRKRAGGGLLRDLPQVDRILGALRDAVQIPLTVKTRLGFDSPDELDNLLPILGRHQLDLVVVHGRTVRQHLASPVSTQHIARAARELPCPVLANGNVFTADQALALWRETGSNGVMIGRGAIRNPWIFTQIRQRLAGAPPFVPTGRDVLDYIRRLYEVVYPPGVSEASQVKKMKLYMNHLGPGVDVGGRFLHEIRRVQSETQFFEVCHRHLDHDHPMRLDFSSLAGAQRTAPDFPLAPHSVPC